MKSFNMKKNSLFLLLLVIAGVQLNAQDEFRTNESISKQLKNNTQPGMKYGPATQPAATTSKGFTGSSLAKEIKEGKYGKVQQGSSSAPAARAGKTNVPNTASLPSNKSAAETDKEIKAAKAKCLCSHPCRKKKTRRPQRGKPFLLKKTSDKQHALLFADASVTCRPCKVLNYAWPFCFYRLPARHKRWKIPWKMKGWPK